MVLRSARRSRKTLEAMPIDGMVTNWSSLAPGPRLGGTEGSTLVNSWAVDHDDRGQAGDSRGVAPGGQVDEAVGADQEEEIVAGPLAVHGLQGIDAVVRAGAPASISETSKAGWPAIAILAISMR